MNNVLNITNKRNYVRKDNKAFRGMIDDRQILKVSSFLYEVLNQKEEILIDKATFQSLIDSSVELYHTLIKSRGVDQGTKRYIEIRRYFISFIIFGEAIIPKCLSCTKKGYPRDLNFLRKYAKAKHIKMLQAILSISRLSEVGNTQCPNFDSVRKGLRHNPKQVIDEFKNDLPSLMKSLKIEPAGADQLKFNWLDSQKKGPNSSITKVNSIGSSFADIYALYKDKSLLNALKNILNKSNNLGVISLLSKYYKIAENTLSDFEKKEVWHSKLIKIPAIENKTRTVAILDYWSQSVLQMFLPIIDRAERACSNSFMFDQNAGRDRAMEFTIGSNPVSLDGKDFTDRFHFKLQEAVLESLLSEKIMVKWFMHILRGRGFKHKKHNRLIYYKIGQPMGANCSFQLANLTHCVFATWCCIKAYESRNKKSLSIAEAMKLTAVCGDDIVFKNKYQANYYQQKMTDLGLKFSESKGFVSQNGIKIAEFCKRTYIKGTDVSAYSPRPASNFMNNDKHVFSINGAYGLTDDQIYRIVEILKPSRRKNIIEIKNLYSIFHNGSKALYANSPLCETALEAKDHIEYGKQSYKMLSFDLLLRYYVLREVQSRAFFLSSPTRKKSGRKLKLAGFLDFKTYQTYDKFISDMDDPLIGTIVEAHTCVDPADSENLLLNPMGFVKAERSASTYTIETNKLLVYSNYDIFETLGPFKHTLLEKEIFLDFLQRNNDFSSKHYNSIRFWFTKAVKESLNMDLYSL